MAVMAASNSQNKSASEMLNRIYLKYPGLKALGEVTIKADPNFTTDKTNVGDIEYFSPTQREVTYGNGFKVANPKEGTHGILYNPQTNNEQSIMLDMLHGMKGASPQYAEQREKLKQELLKNFGGDVEAEWNGLTKEQKQDGKEAFISNWTDGVVRNLLFEGTPEDFKKARYWDKAKETYLSDPKSNAAFEALRGVLLGKKKEIEYQPQMNVSPIDNTAISPNVLAAMAYSMKKK